MKENIINVVLLRMAKGYEETLPFYKMMHTLAASQGSSLELPEIDTDRLMELIGQRQELINELEMRNREISGLKKEVCAALGLNEFTVNNIKGQVKGEGVEALERVLGMLGQLLGKIKELDKNNEETLRRRLQEVMDKLNQTQNTKAARKAYHLAPKSSGGVFIDTSK